MRRHRRRATLLAIALLGAGVAGIAMRTGVAAPGRSQGQLREFTLVAEPVKTVTWTNQGTDLHTTSSLDGSWDSGSLRHEERFSYTFTKPGTYQYICRQHFFQGMRGAIVVEPP